MASRIGDDERSDLQMLYQVSASDISFFKQQQWAVTTHVFVLFAALVAAKGMVDGVGPWPFVVFCVLVLISGIFLTRRLAQSIDARRERLKKVREHLSETFKDAWVVSKEDDHVAILLGSAQIIGCFVVLFVLICGK